MFGEGPSEIERGKKMINITFEDRLKMKMAIQERECPVCHYQGALAMVDDQSVSRKTPYFVAWCPCSAVFELNDDGIRVLAKRQESPRPKWWEEILTITGEGIFLRR